MISWKKVIFFETKKKEKKKLKLQLTWNTWWLDGGKEEMRLLPLEGFRGTRSFLMTIGRVTDLPSPELNLRGLPRREHLTSTRVLSSCRGTIINRGSSGTHTAVADRDRQSKPLAFIPAVNGWGRERKKESLKCQECGRYLYSTVIHGGEQGGEGWYLKGVDVANLQRRSTWLVLYVIWSKDFKVCIYLSVGEITFSTLVWVEIVIRTACGTIWRDVIQYVQIMPMDGWQSSDVGSGLDQIRRTYVR